MPRTRLPWVSTALLLALFALAQPAAADPPDIGQPVLCPRCDVLLILLPGLRADSVTPERMPHLVQWIQARRAVKFTQAISPSSWYLPAATSILTGLPPSLHGVKSEIEFQGGQPAGLPADATLPALLHGAGYRTAAFAATGGTEPHFGLDRGFDSYRAFSREAGLDVIGAKAMEWARAARTGPDGDKPEMMMLLSFQAQGWRSSFGKREGAARKWKDLRHLTMSETLFGLEPAETAELRAYHDQLLRETDDQLAALLEPLPRRMVVIIGSTNGEEFGEHGGMDHGRTLYDEVVHVPLLLALPTTTRWREQTRQLSLREIGPMILDYTYIHKTLGPETPMFNRIDMVQGAGLDEPVASRTDYLGISRLSSLRTSDGWKLIVDRASGRKQLYYVVDDPEERRDLAAQRDDLVRSYAGQLEALEKERGL